MPCKGRDLVRTVSQGRQVDPHNVDSIVQVRSKSTGLHLGFEITGRRRDDSDVHLAGLRLTHPPDLSLLQGAQELDLQRLRQLPDFVEKQSSPVCFLEQSRPIVRSTRERSLYMSEKFRLEEILGNGTAIHRHECTASTGSLVDEPGDQLLPGTALTCHERGRRVPGDTLSQLEGLRHSSAARDDPAVSLLDPHLAPQAVDLTVLL